MQPKTEYGAYLLSQLVITHSLRVRGLKGLRGRHDHFFNRLTNVIMSNAKNTGKKSKAFKLVLLAFRIACKKGGYASFWDLSMDVLKNGLYHQDVRHMTRGSIRISKKVQLSFEVSICRILRILKVLTIGNYSGGNACMRLANELLKCIKNDSTSRIILDKRRAMTESLAASH